MQAITLLFLILTSAIAAAPQKAFALGNEGHIIIGHIAYGLLKPAVRHKVDALLDADEDKLTPKDFPTRTTWADRWRDSDRNGKKVRYNGTREWHFVDVELSDGDLDKACFGHPPLVDQVENDCGHCD
jgi:hypothetical protein